MRVVDRRLYFLSKIEPQADGCWLWAASLSDTGYGSFYAPEYATAKSPLVNAHVLSYQLHVGPVPEGLELDHLCRVRACVNPAHLEPVTHAENARRGLQGRLHTHCPSGHELTEANTYRRPDTNSRQCRECRRRRNREAYHERKARREANRAFAA